MSFRRQGRGRRRTVVLELGEDERSLLRTLFAQVVELLEESDESGEGAEGAGDGDRVADQLADLVGIGTSTTLPGDPAVARLFPNAYRDDLMAAGDFRRYTEVRLRRAKTEHANAAIATLDELAAATPEGADEGVVTLDEVTAAAWLGALNDLRLVLGTRLDVQEDDDPTEWLGDEDAASYYLYHWLTALQGDLLAALD